MNLREIPACRRRSDMPIVNLATTCASASAPELLRPRYVAPSLPSALGLALGIGALTGVVAVAVAAVVAQRGRP